MSFHPNVNMVLKNKTKLITLLLVGSIFFWLFVEFRDSPTIESVIRFSKRGMRVTHGLKDSHRKPLICVLVLTCNRPSVNKTLDSIFKYRALTPSVNFPVIVSQDCGSHPETTQVIKSYGSRVLHVHQPDLGEITHEGDTKVGYYKQTRHHAWALDHAFNDLKCPNVITLEDDLELAPDFFEYFAATLPIYLKDPSIYCVTASNLQAKPGVVNEAAHELLHRSDYFFGWGWMLTKKVFKNLGNWPEVYWDTWMGLPSKRQGRSCIRPEIPRTKNFGREGVSGTAFFDKFVRDIVVNDNFVPFTTMDLSYLQKDKYDADLAKRISSSYLVKDTVELENTLNKGAHPEDATFRIIYNNADEFMKLSQYFGIYGQTWNGMAHTVYNGVMTFMFRKRRMYLIPNALWRGYSSMDDTNED